MTFVIGVAPSMTARQGPTCAVSPSTDCLPHNTASKPSCFMQHDNIYDVASVSDPAKTLSDIRTTRFTPRRATMPKASAHDDGPIHTTVTSEFSMRSASSRAHSSNGFSAPFIIFMHTMILMGILLLKTRFLQRRGGVLCVGESRRGGVLLRPFEKIAEFTKHGQSRALPLP